MATIVAQRYREGTSYQGVDIVTTAKDLKKLFGKGEGASFDGKDKWQWTLKSRMGFYFTIYDHGYGRVKASDDHRFHIGCKNEFQAQYAQQEVIEQLKAIGAIAEVD